MKIKLLALFLFLNVSYALKAQHYYVPQIVCDYVAAYDTLPDTLSWAFSGGSFASYGCSPIDPTYWMTGYGDSVLVTFVNPQAYPSFRVWGMNTDDSATVSVNGQWYPLDSLTALYTPKDTCGQSPGPDGVAFSGGNLIGVLTNVQGNYSYQDVQLNTTNVTTLGVKGLSGLGWGFAGVTVNCPIAGINEVRNLMQADIYPNPFNTTTTIAFSAAVSNAQLDVYNLCGQKIQSIAHVTGNQLTLNASNWPAGIYTMQLVQNNQTIATGKLVVTER